MNKLWRGIIFGTVLEGGAVVLILWLCHVIHLQWGYVVGISTGLIIAHIERTWLKSKETRNADLAAALARGTGTYIIGDKQIKHGNVKPIADRIGVPLAGVQPGAVPRDPTTGTPLVTEAQEESRPMRDMTQAELRAALQSGDVNRLPPDYRSDRAGAADRGYSSS